MNRFLITALLLLTCATAHAQTVQVVRSRLVPFTNPSGKRFQMLLVDWKNTGKTPVRRVKASLRFFDAAGNPVVGTGGMTNDVADQTIFWQESKPVKPGKTYREPNGDGYALLPFPGAKKAATAKVKIIGAM